MGGGDLLLLLVLEFCEAFGLVGGEAFFVVVRWDGVYGEHGEMRVLWSFLFFSCRLVVVVVA